MPHFWQIPYSIANVIMEMSQQSGKHDSAAKPINMAFYQFWYSLALMLTSWSLFWVDIIPGFGSSSNITTFAEK